MKLIPGTASMINGKLFMRLDGLPKMQNGSHGHWRVAAAAKKVWRDSGALYARLAWQKRAPLEKCKIFCERHSSSETDYDGLVSGFKNVIDSLRDAGVIVDDKPSVVIERRYHWVKAPPKKGYITIEVEAA